MFIIYYYIEITFYEEIVLLLKTDIQLQRIFLWKVSEILSQIVVSNLRILWFNVYS